MADYSSMKVPELKKLLGERGLPHTGNKADLIARLQENDKQQAASNPEPQADSSKPAAAEDEIDYDDDDLPALNKDKKDATAEKPAADKATPAVPEKKVDGAATASDEKKPETTATPAAANETDEEAPAATAAPAAPLFTQNLPPTDAKTEAEKRAARAARFGIDPESEEAKKAARAARFGVANDQVAMIDSALPERGPRKRGRGGDGDKDKENKEDEAGENARASKRSNHGEGGGGRSGGGRNRQRGGGGGRRRGGGRGGGQNQGRGGGQKGNKESKPVTVDPAEKAKMEARAKRFAS
ncbi:hypothetical protein N656DRAFT_767019 [Canariomyces notabilis]|uniref:SAP domain-containing protein n=1 Tax=Canariomyces notabilis TaxID=2074819 RepID=A0AAN6YVB9_9PEZI|nr:hypothetical protein N656DRAFT_767019 [Canariomyces arenarius]